MSSAAGRSMILAGHTLTIGGWLTMLVALPAARTLRWDLTVQFAMGFVMFAAMGAGAALKNRGKRHLAFSVDALRAQDSRPPVIWLREFVSDERTDAVQSGYGFDATLEQALVDAVSGVGPVIALSRPGEKLPPPGAARRSATNDEWQQVIEGWLREAKLVLLVAASSDNVSWAIGRCVALLEPKQLVLVIPPELHLNPAAYTQFRDKAQQHFPHPLPEQLGPSGLIGFGPGFTSHFLPDTTTALQRGNRLGAPEVLWKQNLLPVFQALGVAVKAPSPWAPLVRVLLTVAAVLGALALLIAAAMLYDTLTR